MSGENILQFHPRKKIGGQQTNQYISNENNINAQHKNAILNRTNPLQSQNGLYWDPGYLIIFSVLTIRQDGAWAIP